MKLIVGLGNPGPEYAATRHNVGWRVVDSIRLTKTERPKWSKNFDGQFLKSKIDGVDIVLLKPETFMNVSGKSVVAAMQFYKLGPQDLFVIHDDLDLPLGSLKLTPGSGPGGHNGVKSIIEQLGTKDFNRVRIGIGHPTDRTPVEDYVLREFGPDEIDLSLKMIATAVEATIAALKYGLPVAMNKFNS